MKDRKTFNHNGKKFEMVLALSGDYWILYRANKSHDIVYDDSANSDFYGTMKEVEEVFKAYLSGE